MSEQLWNVVKRKNSSNELLILVQENRRRTAEFLLLFTLTVAGYKHFSMLTVLAFPKDNVYGINVLEDDTGMQLVNSVIKMVWNVDWSW